MSLKEAPVVFIRRKGLAREIDNYLGAKIKKINKINKIK